MIVREVVAMLPGAKEINLLWDGLCHPFEPDDELYMAAYGDFKVKRIIPGLKRDEFELEIACLPVKC